MQESMIAQRGNSIQSRVAIGVIMNTLLESEHRRTTEFQLKESSLKRRNNGDLQLLFNPLYLPLY